ncbi:MAG: DUF2079 domain-containing protein [Chloroflexi bacterium]|nr:MAG: DUF2079 domain-containing protein [Chloroflexota bacterium]
MALDALSPAGKIGVENTAKVGALSTVATQAKDGATTLVWRQSIALPLTSIYQHSTTTLNAWITASISLMKRILDRVQKSPASMRVSAITQARWTSLARVFSRKWQQFSERMEPLARTIPLLRLQWITLVWVIAMAALNLAVISPILGNFWADHIPATREQNIQRLLSMIPADASISAGSNLNPHVSERQHLAVFPSLSDSNADTPDIVQYIIVDLNAVFPEDRVSTDNEINHLLLSGQYKELARTEGVVLLARNST